MNAKSVRRLDAQGRVILPSHIRKALNLKESSAVEITMNEDSSVTIRPAEKRCCICGRPVDHFRHKVITGKTGTKYVCAVCANSIMIAKEE